MRALNQTERNNLILKFTILFIVTVAIAVTAIHYNFELPRAMDEQKKLKLKAYNAYLKSEKKIINQMDTLDAEIMAMGNSNIAFDIEMKKILDQVNFNSQFSQDTAYVRLIPAIHRVFLNYLNAKGQAEDFEKQLRTCQSDSKKQKELSEIQIKTLNDQITMLMNRPMPQ